MDNLFFEKEVIITKIYLCIYVKKGTNIHKNRPSHGIVLNISGEKDYIFSKNQRFHVDENDIIFLPKNSSYYVSAQKTGTCYCINFDMADNSIKEPFTMKIKQTQKLINLFNNAITSWNNNKDSNHLFVISSLYEILHILFLEQSKKYLSNKTTTLINPAIDYIDNNFNNEITIAKLAKICDISEAYFRKIFRTQFCTSPVKYINELRIKKAKELLEKNNYKIYEVSEMCGFNDVSSFCRTFKKICQVSPYEYLKSYLNYIG